MYIVVVVARIIIITLGVGRALGWSFEAQYPQFSSK